MSRVMRVVNDYLGIGVADVWVLDPAGKQAFVADAKGGPRPAQRELAAPGGRVRLTVEEIFSHNDPF